MTLTQEQVKQAYELRESEDDYSNADIAELIGVERDDWRAVKTAIDEYADSLKREEVEVPDTDLGRLLQKAKETRKAVDEGDVEALKEAGILESVNIARKDRKLTEEEIDQIEEIFKQDVGISFKEMAESVFPPVSWLTVHSALGARGWITPTYKTITYSTATDEGKAQYAADVAAGRLAV